MAPVCIRRNLGIAFAFQAKDVSSILTGCSIACDCDWYVSRAVNAEVPGSNPGQAASLGVKCYGSTIGSNPIRWRSIRHTPANLKREEDGSSTGLQTRLTRFDPEALLQTEEPRWGNGPRLATVGSVTASPLVIVLWCSWCTGCARRPVKAKVRARPPRFTPMPR